MDMQMEGCKVKLSDFRLKDLKDVLGQLGLAKHGKKQDLLDRILALLSNEEDAKSLGWGRKTSTGKDMVKIINDTHSKMQASGVVDSATKSNNSDLNHIKTKQEVKNGSQIDMTVRCLCGSSVIIDPMIKCKDPMCNDWQHIGCVIIPEKLVEGGQPEIPSQFYCERCRIKRADPFWVATAHPMPSLRLTSSSVSPDGSNTVQTTEQTFYLSRDHREMLQKSEFDLQVWCILLNDKVPFRMQWPQFSDLQVNGIPVRATNRPGTQLLGNNSRDDGPVITTCSREGVNKISFSLCDTRVFCLGIRIGRRQTVQQVLSMIPKENDGEPFEDALARVCRCFGCGASTDNADSDIDLEVLADSVTVNLCCPMSGSRMRTAGRFKPCDHMRCFDLDTFVELNQRSRKWQCPLCVKNYSLESIIIDPYFNRITSAMRNCGEDVTEIDVKPDGLWRVKKEMDSMELALWHNPDGSLHVSANADVKPYPDLSKQIKQEYASEGHTGLKSGIKKNHNGRWEVCKHEESRPSSGNLVADSHNRNVIQMSSSTAGSCRDGEDPSVNQEGGCHFDSAGNTVEFNSFPSNFDPVNSANKIMPALRKDVDIVVLSDSDDDNIILTSQGIHYDSGPVVGDGASFVANHPGASESMQEALGLGTSATTFSLFNDSTDDNGTLWRPVEKSPRGGSLFQFFLSEVGMPAPLSDAQSFFLPSAGVNGYDLSLPDAGVLRDGSEVQDHLASHHPSIDINGTLFDSPMAFGSDDRSHQIFLPSQPTVGSLVDCPSNRTELSNGFHDWISLGRPAGVGQHALPSAFDVNTDHDLVSMQNGMDAFANTASLFQSMNDDRINKKEDLNRHQEFGNIFSHPLQQRSVRPRLSFSLDDDSG